MDASYNKAIINTVYTQSRAAESENLIRKTHTLSQWAALILHRCWSKYMDKFKSLQGKVTSANRIQKFFVLKKKKQVIFQTTVEVDGIG